MKLVAVALVVLVLTTGCSEGRLESTTPSEQAQPSHTIGAVQARPSVDVTRTEVSFVSSKVTSMTIDYTSPIFDRQGDTLTSKPYHRVVSGATVRRLAEALNALDLVDPGSGACPRDDEERFTIDMDNGGNDLTFILQACGRVEVEAVGGLQPELSTSSELIDLVVAAVGAPTVS